MSSKRTEPRSIASQLILLFTLAATLLLSCGLGVFYWIMVRHAFAEDNAVLTDKISGLRADFKEGGPRILGEELKARRTGEHAPYWIRVLDSEGRLSAVRFRVATNLVGPCGGNVDLLQIATERGEGPAMFSVGPRIREAKTRSQDIPATPLDDQQENSWFRRLCQSEWLTGASVHSAQRGRSLPLNDAGREEAASIVRRLAGKRFALVLASPLQRALETCRLAGYGDVAHIEPNLIEWEYGDSEGRIAAPTRHLPSGSTSHRPILFPVG